MTKLVAVVYVGKKPQAFDNVAGSRKSWEGNGDIQEVTPEQAKILTAYADQWALVEGEELEGGAGLPTPDKPREKMTAKELTEYAKRKFGKDLAPAGKKILLDQVEEFEKTLPPIS